MKDKYADWKSQVRRMVDSQIRSRGVADERVLQAMEKVPRQCFVPEEHYLESFEDRPLPIGHQQTISQPYIVGVMTECLKIQPDDRLLEVGTGSGYQAAVLAELARDVHTIEIIETLGREAAERLTQMGYSNIQVHIGDGNYGWPEAAPYDGILLAAAPQEVSQPLIEQLKPGRRLVAPVGPIHNQVLMVYEKSPDGTLQRHRIFEVRFVPLVGDAEWEE